MPESGISTETIARAAFAEIFSHVPKLEKRESTVKKSAVDVHFTIPVQPGIEHEILVYVDGDELHFCVGYFWSEWFPCTQRKCVDSYIEAVSGFLSGRYRILEHYRGKRCVKAELQKPGNDGWIVIRSRQALSLPFPRKKTFREIRNVA